MPTEKNNYLSFNYYQKQSRKTAIYPDLNNNLNYVIVGLGGETGELLNKWQKIIRDNNGKIDNNFLMIQIKKELGDILWYLSNICSELNIDFSEIAKINLDKLRIRMTNNNIRGVGDDR